MTPLHTLLWSQGQNCYELYTQQQLAQAFEPEDCSAWLIWLQNATAFAFCGACGSLNVYQEARRRGGHYWYAYHTNGRHTRKRYLGRTTQVTLPAWKRRRTPFTTRTPPPPPLWDLSPPGTRSRI